MKYIFNPNEAVKNTLKDKILNDKFTVSLLEEKETSLRFGIDLKEDKVTYLTYLEESVLLDSKIKIVPSFRVKAKYLLGLPLKNPFKEYLNLVDEFGRKVGKLKWIPVPPIIDMIFGGNNYILQIDL